MSDQVEVKEKVRWENLEVGEQHEITEWEEGKEPVPTEFQLSDKSKSDAIMRHLIEVGEEIDWRDNIPQKSSWIVANTDEEIWLIAAAKEYRMSPAEFIDYCGGRVDSAIQFAQGNLIVAEAVAEQQDRFSRMPVIGSVD